mmetsp:Transcript_27596/g.52310  ORF Transcript_27596/g.52310 Transcript_27596/m.52310 type:complete len:227 (+) Transcript_27596:140-820(+)
MSISTVLAVFSLVHPNASSSFLTTAVLAASSSFKLTTSFLSLSTSFLCFSFTFLTATSICCCTASGLSVAELKLDISPLLESRLSKAEVFFWNDPTATPPPVNLPVLIPPPPELLCRKSSSCFEPVLELMVDLVSNVSNDSPLLLMGPISIPDLSIPFVKSVSSILVPFKMNLNLGMNMTASKTRIPKINGMCMAIKYIFGLLKGMSGSYTKIPISSKHMTRLLIA